MDTKIKVYYAALILILIIGIWIQLPKPSSGEGHYMAVNVTKLSDGTCQLYWLGGTDYNSFVENLKVGNEVVGHPLAGTMIYNGTDCNTTVKMLMRDTKTYQQIHPEVRK
jgi:hypothetical protein